MDKEKAENQEVQDEQKALLELVNHHGWRFAREKFTTKILQLQDVSEYIDIIQTGNATKLLREMKAQKRAAEILFEVLRDIEGTAQTAIENKPQHKSYLAVIED
jgi:hypothetical protein